MCSTPPALALESRPGWPSSIRIRTSRKHHSRAFPGCPCTRAARPNRSASTAMSPYEKRRGWASVQVSIAESSLIGLSQCSQDSSLRVRTVCPLRLSTGPGIPPGPRVRLYKNGPSPSAQRGKYKQSWVVPI